MGIDSKLFGASDRSAVWVPVTSGRRSAIMYNSRAAALACGASVRIFASRDMPSARHAPLDCREMRSESV
jgi:hypothetical protein